MICKKCKKKISDNAKFCNSCGTKVVNDVKETKEINKKLNKKIVIAIGSILAILVIGALGVFKFKEYKSENVSKKVIKQDLIGSEISIGKIDIKVTDKNLKSMEIEDKSLDTELGIRSCTYKGIIVIEEKKYTIEAPFEAYYVLDGKSLNWSLWTLDFNTSEDEIDFTFKEEPTDKDLKTAFVGQTISSVEITEDSLNNLTLNNIEENNNKTILTIEGVLVDKEVTPSEKINLEATLNFDGTQWVVSNIYGKREKGKESSNDTEVSESSKDEGNMTIEVIENTQKNTYLNKYNNIEKEVNSLMSNYYNLNDSEKEEVISQVYNKWDVFLNEIWSDLKANMDSSAFKSLTDVQIDWIVEKEARAKSIGGSLESTSALESLADSTKSRCYYLIDLYM